MSKPKARLDAEGFEYWILTNGKNSVVFRLGKQSQSNVIHIDGWPHGNESRNGTWQTRQATNMWNELIRIGFRPEFNYSEWMDKGFGESPENMCGMCGGDLKSCHCVE